MPCRITPQGERMLRAAREEEQRREPPHRNPGKPMKLAAKLTDRFWDYFFQPVAWLLAALLGMAIYENYKLNRQFDTVCDAIKLRADEFIDRPNNGYAKAQNICEDRMPED